MCLASQNNHPTSLASSWDISFFKSLVQQDPTGSNKVAHLNIPDVYVSPNRKYINLSLIYHILDFSFFMSQDDAYFHIHQNDPGIVTLGLENVTSNRTTGAQQRLFVIGPESYQLSTLVTKSLSDSPTQSCLVDF